MCLSVTDILLFDKPFKYLIALNVNCDSLWSLRKINNVLYVTLHVFELPIIFFRFKVMDDDHYCRFWIWVGALLQKTKLIISTQTPYFSIGSQKHMQWLAQSLPFSIWILCNFELILVLNISEVLPTGR